MEFHRQGSSTCVFSDMPVVISAAAVVGPREGQGPLGHLFDMVYSTTLFEETSWEKAESKMLRHAVDLAMAKAKICLLYTSHRPVNGFSMQTRALSGHAFEGTQGF